MPKKSRPVFDAKDLKWVDLWEYLKNIEQFDTLSRSQLYKEFDKRYEITNQKDPQPLHVEILQGWFTHRLYSFLKQVNHDTGGNPNRYYLGNCAEQALYEIQLKKLNLKPDASDADIHKALTVLPPKDFHDFLKNMELTRHQLNSKLNHLTDIAQRVSNEKIINAHLTKLYNKKDEWEKSTDANVRKYAGEVLKIHDELNLLYQYYQEYGILEPLLTRMQEVEKSMPLYEKSSSKGFFSGLFTSKPDATEIIHSFEKDLLKIKAAEPKPELREFKFLSFEDSLDELKNITQFDKISRAKLYKAVTTMQNKVISESLEGWNNKQLNTLLYQLNKDKIDFDENVRGFGDPDRLRGLAEEAIYHKQLKILELKPGAKEEDILKNLRSIPTKTFENFLKDTTLVKHPLNKELNRLSELAERVSNEKRINLHLTSLFTKEQEWLNSKDESISSYGYTVSKVFDELNRLYQTYQENGDLGPILKKLEELDNSTRLIPMDPHYGKFSLRNFFSGLFPSKPDATKIIRSFKDDLLAIKAAQTQAEPTMTQERPSL